MVTRKRTFLVLKGTEVPVDTLYDNTETLVEWDFTPLFDIPQEAKIVRIEAPSQRLARNCLSASMADTATLIVELFEDGTHEIVKNRYGPQ